MDCVEKDHLAKYAPDDDIACPHPPCVADGVTLSGVGPLKNHFKRKHFVTLRDPTLRRSAFGVYHSLGDAHPLGAATQLKQEALHLYNTA